MSRALRLPSWLAPPAAEVAVEFSVGRVTVTRLGKGGQSLAGSGASEPLPPGALVPGVVTRNIEHPAVLVAALKKALERAGFGSPKRVALILPDAVARVSLIHLETVPSRPADLDQLVRWNVKKAAPFPIEEAVLSYVTIASEPGNTTLAAVVAHRAVIAEYEAIADAIGAHAGQVEIASFAVINSAVAARVIPEGDWLLIYLAADWTTIGIMRGPSLVFYRHRANVDDEPLSALVHQTAMYYEDRLGGARFSRVVIAGGASEASRDLARREISERLQVPVESMASLLGERGAA
jgi:Tfp pilus assembly PilM family ATPase